MPFLSTIASLGVAQLGVVAAGCALFMGLIGVCCPSWDEPFPRVVQLAYPSDAEKHWFLMHASKTALRKKWYVSSISQFVGARGTTGAKLMLMMTTATSVFSSVLGVLLWTSDSMPDAAFGLGLLASAGLFTLGFVESAIEWAPLAVDWPDLEDPLDEAKMSDYYASMEIQRLSQAEDTVIKAQFAALHTLAAFVFIGSEFAAQLVYDQPVAKAVAAVGVSFFGAFCLLQWLTGVNDPLLLASPLLARFAVANFAPRFQLLYWPQGSIRSRLELKLISFLFISVEMVAFASLASARGWNCLDL